MKRILFYPGTFNPPHLGHVSAVKVAVDNLDFDEVWIMPCGKRIDKVIPTSYEDRRNLANIFVEYIRTIIQVPVKLITTELDDTEGKYTHEVIMELKSQSKDEIFQLCGMDGFMGIKERVIGPNEKFVLIKRSGYEFPKELSSKNNLVILEEDVPGISSTKIREMVQNGDKEYKKLIPEKVASYIEENGLYLMKEFLIKDTDGNWNTIPPIPADKMSNVNCHKFILYVIGKISWDEMVSDPRTQKATGLDFTYGEKARMISDQEFVPIKDKESLLKFADSQCENRKSYVGQIMDSSTGEMAHSFIVERTTSGEYKCFDKLGFKQYLFSVHSLESLLDFVNDKGEKSYQNQKWRFVPFS